MHLSYVSVDVSLIKVYSFDIMFFKFYYFFNFIIEKIDFIILKERCTFLKKNIYIYFLNSLRFNVVIFTFDEPVENLLTLSDF